MIEKLIYFSVYVEAILTTLACLVPFLSHNELLGLPTKISSAIKGIPISCHPKAVSLICGYLLPLLLGMFISLYFYRGSSD